MPQWIRVVLIFLFFVVLLPGWCLLPSDKENQTEATTPLAATQVAPSALSAMRQGQHLEDLYFAISVVEYMRKIYRDMPELKRPPFDKDWLVVVSDPDEYESFARYVTTVEPHGTDEERVRSWAGGHSGMKKEWTRQYWLKVKEVLDKNKKGAR